jgi:hypothetical protein
MIHLLWHGWPHPSYGFVPLVRKGMMVPGIDTGKAKTTIDAVNQYKGNSVSRLAALGYLSCDDAHTVQEIFDVFAIFFITPWGIKS